MFEDLSLDQIFPEINLPAIPLTLSAAPEWLTEMECLVRAADKMGGSISWTVDTRLQQTVPALFEVMRGADIHRQIQAVKLLRNIGCTGEDAVRELISLWSTGGRFEGSNDAHFVRFMTHSLRSEIAETLELMGMVARPAIPQLLEGFSCQDPDGDTLRFRCAAALVCAGERRPELIPVLATWATSKYADLAQHGFRYIEMMGEHAAPVLPTLKDLVTGEGTAIHEWARGGEFQSVLFVIMSILNNCGEAGKEIACIYEKTFPLADDMRVASPQYRENLRALEAAIERMDSIGTEVQRRCPRSPLRLVKEVLKPVLSELSLNVALEDTERHQEGTAKIQAEVFAFARGIIKSHNIEVAFRREAEKLVDEADEFQERLEAISSSMSNSLLFGTPARRELHRFLDLHRGAIEGMRRLGYNEWADWVRTPNSKDTKYVAWKCCEVIRKRLGESVRADRQREKEELKALLREIRGRCQAMQAELRG